MGYIIKDTKHNNSKLEKINKIEWRKYIRSITNVPYADVSVAIWEVWDSFSPIFPRKLSEEYYFLYSLVFITHFFWSLQLKVSLSGYTISGLWFLSLNILSMCLWYFLAVSIAVEHWWQSDFPFSHKWTVHFPGCPRGPLSLFKIK